MATDVRNHIKSMVGVTCDVVLKAPGEVPRMIVSEVPHIVEWDIRAKTYEAFPLMSDGTLGPPIALRALFEQYQAEAR
jgi:hypothetical protein